jgi:DNA invertase Pin-like site-specific DNA recombinase
MKTKNTTKTVKPVCTLSTKNTAVIYARVSSVGDRQSTERQVKDLSDYALYKQLEVRKVFEEHISGAKKNEERPVLCQTLEYCKQNSISTLLVSELSRMGRNAFEVLASVKELLDCGINLYIQKEQFNLLGEDGKPSLFAPIMLATLSTCAQLERENITFRLQSGRKQYVAKGGRLGRKPGSVKTVEQKREEYKDVIALLRKGYVIRDVAKLTRKSVSTVQRVKKEFC